MTSESETRSETRDSFVPADEVHDTELYLSVTLCWSSYNGDK